MTLQYNIYSILLVTGAVISLFLAGMAWKKREANGALYVSILFILVAEWSLANSMELASIDIASKLFWAKLSYIGIVTVAPLWFLFTLDYTQNAQVIKKSRVIFLFLIPLITIYLAFTNELYHLVWVSTTLVDTSEGFMVIYVHGPAAIISTLYSYILMVTGLALIGQTLFKTSHIYQRQSMMVFLAGLIPFISNSIYAAGLSPFYFNPTPLALTISGILILWSIYGYKFLDIMPPAYKSLFASMKNGVMVLDTLGRIMDINPAAQTLLNIDDSCIGNHAGENLQMWDEISPKGKPEGIKNIKLDNNDSQMG